MDDTRILQTYTSLLCKGMNPAHWVQLKVTNAAQKFPPSTKMKLPKQTTAISHLHYSNNVELCRNTFRHFIMPWLTSFHFVFTRRYCQAGFQLRMSFWWEKKRRLSRLTGRRMRARCWKKLLLPDSELNIHMPVKCKCFFVLFGSVSCLMTSLCNLL